MATKIIVRNSIARSLMQFSIVMAFRFFLGKPLTGKRIDNSTFTKGATRGKPGRVLTRWQKKPHIHRALIRAAVFWPIVGIIALAIYNATDALLVLVCSAFPLGYLAYRRGRFVFFDAFTSTDAANGVVTQRWLLKNKYRRLFRMQPMPGYATKKMRREVIEEFPPEVAKALLESINALNPGETPATKVVPYKRKSGKR